MIYYDQLIINLVTLVWKQWSTMIKWLNYGEWLNENMSNMLVYKPH